MYEYALIISWRSGVHAAQFTAVCSIKSKQCSAFVANFRFMLVFQDRSLVSIRPNLQQYKGWSAYRTLCRIGVHAAQVTTVKCRIGNQQIVFLLYCKMAGWCRQQYKASTVFLIPACCLCQRFFCYPINCM